MNKNYAVLLCGGTGTRSKLGFNKILFPINGVPMFIISLQKMQISNCFDEYILVINENNKNEIESLINKYRIKNVNIVNGGNTRGESVQNALKHIKNSGTVLIHDSARPYADPNLFIEVLKAAQKTGAATACIKTIDTIAITENNKITSFPSRENLVNIQTPQAFDVDILKQAYKIATAQKKSYSDDASLFMQVQNNISLVYSNNNNKKLTTKEDFKELSDKHIKIGAGFDMHRLVENRDLVLGGVKIDYTKGLLGHSDADSLLHAITDALLSAAGQKDIGHLFPDTDIKFKNISSSILLKEAADIVKTKGYKILSISASIIAEKPKMAQYIPKIEKSICSLLNIPINCIKVSATTMEGLGFIGREEGIGAYANCILQKSY